MNRARIRGVINEIEAILEESSEYPVTKKDQGVTRAINAGKLAAVVDILRAVDADAE